MPRNCRYAISCCHDSLLTEPWPPSQSAIHSTVKHLHDQIDNAMEWNTSLRYIQVHQSHRRTCIIDILMKFHRYCKPACNGRSRHCLSKRQISCCSRPKYVTHLSVFKLLIFLPVHTCCIIHAEAAKVYFISLKRRSKMVLAGKLDESKKRQRKVQRKHNVSHIVQYNIEIKISFIFIEST